MTRLFSLFVFLFAVVGMGLLIGISNIPGEWYAGLTKPAFTPPNWLFGPAWTVLYVMIAVAGWKIWSSSGLSALFSLWALQLGLNFAWSPIVFTLHDLALGLTIIAVLLLAILVLIWRSSRTDKVVALLLLPYAAWVCFAGYLNAGLLVLN